MSEIVYSEWDQPREYVQFINSSFPVPLFPIRFFLRFAKLLFPKNKQGRAPHVKINDSGILSTWGRARLIKYEEIFGITFNCKTISNKTFKVMYVAHYEDLENLIPDESSFPLSDEVRVAEIQELFTKKGIKVENKLNV